MPTTLTFFPVDNGDMTLITLFDHSATTILIDVNVRTAADNPDDNDTPDVMADLHGRINRDAKRRPYVDVFMVSHPDLDHCRGLERHFHLGKLEDYPDDKKPDGEKKIVIREIWSSPIVFRRRSSTHTLSDDAAAFNCEAKRRVKLNKETSCQVQDGDRVRILGEDINGKTDGIPAIVTKVGDELSMICGRDFSSYFKARLLAPLDSQARSQFLEESFQRDHELHALVRRNATRRGQVPDRRRRRSVDLESSLGPIRGHTGSPGIRCAANPAPLFLALALVR
jgi:hypothetical protein